MFGCPAADEVGMHGEARTLVRATVRHGAPVIVEGTVIPLVLFTVTVHSLGVTAGLWSSLGWSAAALGRRAVRRRGASGFLVLTGAGTALRLVTVVWTASPFLFFVQPVIVTIACAFAFGLSVPLRRPLAARLGADLVPLGAADWARPDVRRACARLSLVWCAALAANAALTLWLLWHFTVTTFVVLRPLVGVVTTLPAIVASFVLGARVVRRSEGRLRLHPPCAPARSDGDAIAAPAPLPALRPAPTLLPALLGA